MYLSLWRPQAKKIIGSNVALDKLIHLKIKLAFLRITLGLTGNQLTKVIVPHFQRQKIDEK